MNKKVSIIVPVYNAAGYLERCMESLLGQTYQNMEILLIDDGSMDESGRICDSYAKQQEQVKVIHTANAGVSAARNRGIQNSDGEYLTFVDADDVLSKDMVAHLVEILEQTDSDVAGCDYWEFHKDEELYKRRAKESDVAVDKADAESKEMPQLLTGTEFIEKGILRSDTRCWSKLYKRESIGELQFESGLTIGEDMLFLLQLALQGRRFCRSNEKKYGYFINEAGAMMRSFKDSYMDQIVCWQKALEIISVETPGMTDRAEAILLISIMLTVGKLAMLSKKERKEKTAFVQSCSELIRKHSRNRSAMAELDKGYQIKVAVYKYAPQIYLSLYGWLYRSKNRKR